MPDPEPPPPRHARHRVVSDDAAGTTVWVLTILLSFLALLSVAVWVLVSVDDGAWASPWPVWVAGPPVVVLATVYAAGFGRPKR